MSTCSADVSTAFMLQNGIANMFQNVRDANNQPVNPLPISIECVRLYGHRQPDTQHYAFMGISLIQFAASSYLRQRFNQCKDATLFQLQKALMQRQNLQKTIGEMFNIPSDTMDVATIVEGILGITNDLYGHTIVCKFIQNVLDIKGPVLFQLLPKTLRKSLGLHSPVGTNTPATRIPARVPSIDTRPIISYCPTMLGSHKFDIFLKESGGRELKYFAQNEKEKMWACRIVYQLTEKSIWRSHFRVAQSKKKARNLTCQDILNFYKRQSEQIQLDKLDQPGALPEQAIPLPIDPSQYSKLDPVDLPTPDQLPSPAPSSNIPYYYSLDDGSVHLAAGKRTCDVMMYEDEDTALMEILLGNMQQLGTTDRPITPEENNGAGKRFRSEPTASFDQSLPASPAQSIAGGGGGNNNNNNEPSRSDVALIRSKLDIVKLEQILVDPVRNYSPKSCLLPLVHQKNGLEYSASFERSGPAHELVFEATVMLTAGQNSISATGKGVRKSESEQNAIRQLIKMLTDV